MADDKKAKAKRDQQDRQRSLREVMNFYRSKRLELISGGMAPEDAISQVNEWINVASKGQYDSMSGLNKAWASTANKAERVEAAQSFVREHPFLAGANTFSQGVTFNFGDELAGLVFGNDDIKKTSQATVDAFAEENPIVAIALEAGGNAVTSALGAGAAAGVLGKVAPKVGKAVGRVTNTALKRAGLLGGLGALEGGVSEFGRAEGPLQDRLVAGATGAAFGGGTGALLGLGGTALGAAGRGIGDAVAPGSAAFRNASRLGTQLLQDLPGQNAVPDLARSARNLPSATGDEVRLLDLPIRGAVGESAQLSPSVLRNMTDIADDRVTQEGARLSGGVREILPEGRNMDDFLGQLQGEGKLISQAFQELEDAVPGMSLPSSFSRDPIMGPALDQARKVIDSRAVQSGGRTLAETRAATNRILKKKSSTSAQKAAAREALEEAESFDFVALQQVKMQLDNQIDAAFRAGENATANAMRDSRRSLTAFMEGNISEFPELQARFAANARIRDAMDAGQNILKTGKKSSPRDLQELLDGLGEDELEAFRAGALETVERAADQSQAPAGIFTPEVRKKVSMLGPEGSQSRLEALVDTERRISDFRPPSELQTPEIGPTLRSSAPFGAAGESFGKGGITAGLLGFGRAINQGGSAFNRGILSPQNQKSVSLLGDMLGTPAKKSAGVMSKLDRQALVRSRNNIAALTGSATLLPPILDGIFSEEEEN